MNSVDTLSRMVNTNIEKRHDMIMTLAGDGDPDSQDHKMTGSIGKTHGAKTDVTQAKNEVRMSIIERVYSKVMRKSNENV
ncbi:MAG TPA: hypothetical protein PLW93_04595 [Candidatus Absconditabacterales bacterium]|nr:hypothetical protein [Candidatus Absconditabacterales bacterium]